MKEQRKVPKLRFPGFTDDWEQRKFSETFSTLQNNTLSRAELSQEEGSALNVHYGDVLIKYGEILDVSAVILPFIPNVELVSKFKSSTLEDGDIIMADTAEDETAGKCSEVLNIQGEPVISGLHTIPCRPVMKFASGYLGYYMNSGAYHNQLLPLMQGIKVTSISKSALQDTVLSWPTSVDEQTKIGQCFMKLDNLITLHQRKYDSIKELKKAMLQKMFPKEGESVPELRFPGFTDDWEQRKCGDVLIERNIQHPQSKDYPLVSFTVENGVTPKTDRYEREQLVKGDKAAKKYKETRFDDIVYNPANLKFGAIARNKFGNAVFSPIYITFEVNKDFAIPSFIEMFVTRNSFIQNALQYQQGTVYERMAVNTDDFANLEIMLPSKEEQYQIGELFDSIDKTITLHQRKCDSLKELKKGLLQQMFV